MAIHEIRIDRSKTLTEEPGTGHNRWHPDIPPVVRCQPGDEVVLETRDALDGQVGPAAGLDAVAAVDLGPVHPLTGPVYVEGAEPGDLLAVEIIDIEPDRYGFTVQIPGFGFLRDVFPEPYKVNWDIAGDWATSAELPGVRIPGSPFMGTIGLSPGHELLATTTAREQALIDQGGLALPPSAAGAVPADPRLAAEGLRTIPPREQAGNVDIKQLGQGAVLLIPVDTPGALYSAGDAHFAQGDCETCGTAIEMSATLRVRFRLRKGEAADKNIRDLRYHPRGLLPAAGVRRAAQVLRHHRHLGHQGRRQPVRGHNARRAQRPAQHDRPSGRAGLDPPAGLRHLQRRRRPQDQPARRRAQHARVRVPAGGHLRQLTSAGVGLLARGPSLPPAITHANLLGCLPTR